MMFCPLKFSSANFNNFLHPEELECRVQFIIFFLSFSFFREKLSGF